MSHVKQAWRAGDNAGGRALLWSRSGDRSFMIADFSVSPHLSEEAKRANAERARVCKEFCEGVDNEVMLRFLKRGLLLSDILTRYATTYPLAKDERDPWESDPRFDNVPRGT